MGTCPMGQVTGECGDALVLFSAGDFMDGLLEVPGARDNVSLVFESGDVGMLRADTIRRFRTGILTLTRPTRRRAFFGYKWPIVCQNS